jgi:hypothetical protein
VVSITVSEQITRLIIDTFHRLLLILDHNLNFFSQGRAHPERSGFEGPWTIEPLKFDNSYFVSVIETVPFI